MRLLFLFAIIILVSCKPTSTPKYAIDPGDTTWYTIADTMPQMKGGEKEFEKYLVGCVRYPQLEKEKGVDGTVYIGFTIEKDGSISYVKVEKGVDLGPGLGREGVRVIEGMPDWDPAVQNGKAVRMRMTVPIRFLLQ